MDLRGPVRKHTGSYPVTLRISGGALGLTLEALSEFLAREAGVFITLDSLTFLTGEGKMPSFAGTVLVRVDTLHQQNAMLEGLDGKRLEVGWGAGKTLISGPRAITRDKATVIIEKEIERRRHRER